MDTPLLHRQFPNVYRPEIDKLAPKTGEEMKAPEDQPWSLLPTDLLPFLMEKVTPAAAIMLLALKGAASWEDYVTKSDKFRMTRLELVSPFSLIFPTQKYFLGHQSVLFHDELEKIVARKISDLRTTSPLAADWGAQKHLVWRW